MSLTEARDPLDARLAGAAGIALGCGIAAALAGAAGGGLPLALGGGVVVGAALVLLMAPRWIEPLLVVAASVPLPALWSAGGVRVAAAAPVTAAAIAAWALHAGTVREPLRVGRLPTRAVAALGLVLLAATAAAPGIGLAARELLNLLVLGGLLVAATDLLGRRPSLRPTVAGWLAALAAVCGGLAVMEAVGVIPGEFPRFGTPFFRAALGFGQPNGLGLFLAVCVPLVAWRAGSSRGGSAWLWRGALALVAAGLLATFSRGGWASVVVGAAALGVAGAWRRAFRILGGAVLFVVVLDLASGGMVRDTIERTIGDWVVEQRAALMLVGVLMFLERPWLGFGPGGFESGLDRFGIQVPELWDLQPTPHNAYVQWAAEAGVGGLVLYLVLLRAFAVAARDAIRAGSDASAALDRALLWSLGILAVSGFFIWPFAHGTGQAVVLVLAMIASAPDPRRPPA